jgi:hypothetical protein
VKNGESGRVQTFYAIYGGKVKKALNLKALAVLAFAGVGLMLGLGLTGCKSAPELTAAQAQALIQAKYDQTPPVGANINVDDLGMRMGVTAKYWDRSKAYPNKFWADFTLSADGKKAIKLMGGGDTIQWRPESADDKSFSVVVQTVAANHLKARDVKDPVDEVGGTKSVVFTEAVNLDGVPSPLQDIAHNPGNKLSGKKTATFALDNGAWKLVSIV